MDQPNARLPTQPSALPSVRARLLAFSAILLAGLAGGFIGFAFADFQCHGSCGAHQGVGAVVGALLGASGVAVVSVLTLRAMGEWRTIQSRDDGHERDRKIS